MGLDMQLFNQLTTFLFNSNSFTIIWKAVLFLILYGLEDLLQENLLCPCAKGSNFIYTLLFFLFPSVILLLVSVRLHCGVFRYVKWRGDREKQPAAGAEPGVQSGNNCNCTRVFYYIYIGFTLFFKILTPPVIWIVILFLDGDYYTCAEIMKDDKASNKTCAEFRCSGTPRNVLSGQQHYCDTSRLIGASLIAAFLLILLLLHLLHLCMDKYYYNYEYSYMLRNKTEQLIMKALENKAEEEAKTEFNNRSEKLHPILNHVSETQQSNTGAEMTNEAPSSETVTLPNRPQRNQQLADDLIPLFEIKV